MEDTPEIEDKMSEAISDNASQKKEETRDEMLARHRSFIHHKSFVITSLLFISFIS